VKLWNAKSTDCVCTLDAHEDKVWALDVAETADGGLEVWSGSADSMLVRWKDCTAAEQEEASAARDLHMQQEQEMQIAMYAREFHAALKLALKLRQPRALRTVLERLLPTPSGERQLRETLATLGADDLEHCLKCARDWNTTAQHSLTAQRLLHVLLKVTPTTKLRSASQLKSCLEALMPYTDRHFERLYRLQQGAHFLSYMLATMQSLDANDPDTGMAELAGVESMIGVTEPAPALEEHYGRKSHAELKAGPDVAAAEADSVLEGGSARRAPTPRAKRVRLSKKQ